MGSGGGGGGKSPIGMIAPIAGGMLGGAMGGGGKGGAQPNTGVIPPPQIAEPTPPSAPALAPDRTNFGAYPEGVITPSFLGVNSSMTPEQQRSRIATMALAGDDSAYRGDEATNYYKYLAQTSFTDPTGNLISGASPLPVERNYATQVLGKSFGNDTTANFLTQLLGP